MTIQIVRFKDGLDVISYVNTELEEVELTNPMMFQIANAHLLLEHWLPLAVMKEKSVKIPKSEILCFMEPNTEFAEYYDHAVTKVNLVVNSSPAGNKEEPNELDLVMDAMEELESNKELIIH